MVRLRWSGETIGYKVKTAAIADPSIELGVPGGQELMALVDAFSSGTSDDQHSARAAVRDRLGDRGFVDAAAVYGNFEMMNRVAEASGITITPQAVEREADMMRDLGLYDIIKSQQVR